MTIFDRRGGPSFRRGLWPLLTITAKRAISEIEKMWAGSFPIHSQHHDGLRDAATDQLLQFRLDTVGQRVSIDIQ